MLDFDIFSDFLESDDAFEPSTRAKGACTPEIHHKKGGENVTFLKN